MHELDKIIKNSKYEKAINKFLSDLYHKDEYTYNHSLRVANNSLIICNLLNLSKIQIEEIVISALLHDIGKIKIPISILCGNQKLTEDEWIVIKCHPQYGVNYIKQDIKNINILNNILYHHERIDGSGYPHQLNEQEITLGAKIISLSDSIDAMLTDRSYKQKITTDEAKNIIIKDKGKLFNTRIADIVIDNWDIIKQNYC